MAKFNTNSSGDRNTTLLVIGAALIIVILFVVWNFWQLNRNTQHQTQYIALTTDAQVLSQQVAKSAAEAATGNLDAFDELSAAREQIDSDLNVLQTGNDTGLPSSPQAAADQLDELELTWQRINNSSGIILDRTDLVLDLSDAANNFAASIPKLQSNIDQVTRLLTQTRAPSTQVFVAGRQLVLSDRMLRRVSDILKGGEGAVSAADNFSRDAAFFEHVLDGLMTGDQTLGITAVRNPQALELLGEISQLFEQSKPDIDLILSSSSELFEVRSAADEILLDTQDMFDQAKELSGTYASLGDNQLLPSVTAGLIGAIMAVALLMLLGISQIGATRRRAQKDTLENKRNQEAIFSLLDEMSSLAEGDLTVQATVTEDITGAIADSVNFAVESLRDLVMDINDTAKTVANSAQETRATTNVLAESSIAQEKQIGSATEAINNMSSSFDEMAKRSLESSKMSRRSVEVASEGANKVRETIKGMDTIRDQIQETSKRIKRLGESSQEIGDIVELINGIAEQTNILALNAAIQAASAGGAGRGFAVVADEVQRLAERSTNATRRIETLVDTIQADTSEAIESMESTTTEVVQGAKLAEDAGSALDQIESASQDLSNVIQKIASEAQRQSQSAAEVATLMTSIREISVKTSEGSKQTATSVGNLAELVRELRDSVSDFKLPED
ncbi:MAG: type IV pili methyl-accepting chemotaxis transducer N-terminal domain-containing protein [Proteobacteria bacterium]|nr:type IV pili methyl-accepting chemotaxis transducer N-terminal domain-containing protein [Pseudomonadota bacterium]